MYVFSVECNLILCYLFDTILEYNTRSARNKMKYYPVEWFRCVYGIVFCQQLSFSYNAQWAFGMYGTYYMYAVHACNSYIKFSVLVCYCMYACMRCKSTSHTHCHWPAYEGTVTAAVNAVYGTRRTCTYVCIVRICAQQQVVHIELGLSGLRTQTGSSNIAHYFDYY